MNTACPFARCRTEVTHCDGACHGLAPDGTPLTELPPLAPIDMILHCPKCHVQHIDAPDQQDPNERDFGMTTKESNVWNNPPHRSHLCHECGWIWRPADVPTNGVAEIKTRGKNDSPIEPESHARITSTAEISEALKHECQASGRAHSFGPHGPGGTVQCEWCGEPIA